MAVVAVMAATTVTVVVMHVCITSAVVCGETQADQNNFATLSDALRSKMNWSSCKSSTLPSLCVTLGQSSPTQTRRRFSWRKWMRGLWTTSFRGLGACKKICLRESACVAHTRTRTHARSYHSYTHARATHSLHARTRHFATTTATQARVPESDARAGLPVVNTSRNPSRHQARQHASQHSWRNQAV